MKWPLVWRSTLDRIERHYAGIESDLASERATRIGWERSCETWRMEAQADRIARREMGERYDALLEKFTALRVAGAVPEPKPDPEWTTTGHDPRTLTEKGPEADDLRLLIADRSGNDLRKRGMMLRQLERDRADGLDADEIRRRIEHGVQSEGVPA